MIVSGALSGIRVLDLTRVLAGPYCTMMLADLGAEVIKIEAPNGGDDMRHYPPFRNDSSVFFAYLNRNKQGISLNLKTEKGRELFLKMVECVDIVVENFRPGVMDKLGIGYEVLKKINPRIIYGAVTGYGTYGRDSDRPGYDIVAQAVGGLMSITGLRGTEPTSCGNAMGDVLGGLNLTIGLLAALIARKVTGRGQKVDVSLVDSVVASLEACPLTYLETGEEPPRIGNEHAATSPYDSFTARDKKVIIAAANQKLYEKLVALMGRPELLEDPRYATLDARNVRENRDELAAIINEWASQYDAKELVDMVLAAGIPAGPINDMKDITEDPHIARDREMFVEMDHPVIGKVRVIGNPVKLTDTPVEINHCSPAQIGSDNETVFGRILALLPEEVKRLKEDGVL